MKIVKFESTGCIPCKIAERMLGDLGLEVDQKININEDEESREKYDVMKAPTFMLLDDNDKEVERVIGLDEQGVIALFDKRK